MKTHNCFLSIFICCFTTFLLAISTLSFTSYAVENENVEPPFNSVVEIEGYEIEGGYIEAGKANNITLTLRNANKYTAVNGLIITVTSDSGMIFPTYGNDNQFVIGKLDAGDTFQLTIPMMANTNLKGDYIDFKCNMLFESNGNGFSNTSTMILPTQNISSIYISSLDVSAHATVNGKSLLSINYANNSAGNINDATLIVSGNVSESTKSIALGSIVSGKSYTKDFNIIYTKPGEQIISIKLIYTDINNQSIETDLGTYSVTVGDESESGQGTLTDNTMMVWGGRALALFALIAVSIVTFVYVKKR